MSSTNKQDDVDVDALLGELCPASVKDDYLISTAQVACGSPKYSVSTC